MVNIGTPTTDTALTSASNGNPMVQLEGVRKSFGDNLVLDGIDLSVATGEVLVIIGPSGSGKRRSCAASTCSSRSRRGGSTSRARR